MAANAAAVTTAAAAIHPAAPIIAPPAYKTTLTMATVMIGLLPSLHPRPNHSNIRALEQDLFNKLQAIQSAQSDKWGYRGLAEQPTEYAMKSATPQLTQAHTTSSASMPSSPVMPKPSTMQVKWNISPNSM